MINYIKKTCKHHKGLRQQMNHALFIDVSFHLVFQFKSWILTIFSNTFKIKVSSHELTQIGLKLIIEILTLKGKVYTILITWEFDRLHLTQTTTGLVSHNHDNPKHTRWIVEEEWLHQETLKLSSKTNSFLLWLYVQILTQTLIK